MSDKKTCFIIMPISTPIELVKEYHDDPDHFEHVLNELFIPAIENAEFTPIKPSAEGTENIQAGIISNLENADLVLCDLTILNPNVFFELGIRTALNKPVCLVKDSRTPKIPFDTSTIHTHTYKNDLNAWIVKNQIPELTKHIKTSIEKSNGENSLWKYFGLKVSAKPPENSDDTSYKMDIIMGQLENLRKNFKSESSGSFDDGSAEERFVFKNVSPAMASLATESLNRGIEKYGGKLEPSFQIIGNTIIIKLLTPISDEIRNYLLLWTKKYQIAIKLLDGNRSYLFSNERKN